LRPHTFGTLFGLYAASGLRASEVLHLDRNDVDLINGVLTIRDTKFGKTRYVPVHPSTQRALKRYAKLRASPVEFVGDWTSAEVSACSGVDGAAALASVSSCDWLLYLLLRLLWATPLALSTSPQPEVIGSRSGAL
jgi:hypothetical protein